VVDRNFFFLVDGSISFEEFTQAFLEAEETARRKFAYKQLFEAHDKDSDQSLSLKETKSLMSALGLDADGAQQFQTEFGGADDALPWQAFENHMEQLYLLKKVSIIWSV
jgi:Ca2+-binding EF-hand superfamily protein